MEAEGSRSWAQSEILLHSPALPGLIQPSFHFSSRLSHPLLPLVQKKLHILLINGRKTFPWVLVVAGATARLLFPQSIPTAPGALTQQCRAGKGDLSANTRSLFPVPLVKFAKIQFRDVNGAIPVKIVGVEGISPCRCSHCHMEIGSCHRAGIPAKLLPGRQGMSSLSPGSLPDVLHDLLIDPRLAAPPH